MYNNNINIDNSIVIEKLVRHAMLAANTRRKK